MKNSLAIVTPNIGARSETFIRRHIQELLPKKTVVVTASCGMPEGSDWFLNCPVLQMNWLPQAGFMGRRLQIQAYAVQALNQAFGLYSTEPNWRDVKQFLREYHVQVLLGQYLDKSLSWLKVAQELNIKFYSHAHGYDISKCLRSPRWQKKYLRYNEADGIITINQVSRERLVNLGIKPNKVHVIPYGVNVPRSPIERVEQETTRCLAVGRMVAKKAPLKTLEAFRQAARICPTLRLDFVGDGFLFPVAEEFVRTFELGDKVKLLGGQPNVVVKQLMQKADIFLQHSLVDPHNGDEEGLPVAILEAMANSLPIISTNHAGIPEAVIDGFTGYLVDEGDIQGMSDRIVDLAENTNLRQTLGKNGWHRARQFFSWEEEKKRLLDLFDFL